MVLCGFFMLVSVRFHVCKITLNQFWWLNGHISESKLVLVRKSNRKAMNRNWSNQKANPALKTKVGNK